MAARAMHAAFGVADNYTSNACVNAFSFESNGSFTERTRITQVDRHKVKCS